jgi:chemotaxis protein CheC
MARLIAGERGIAMLTEYHLDALKEIVNTGIGRAAASLNSLLSSHIDLEVPSIRLFASDETDLVRNDINATELACVKLSFKGFFGGSAILVFPPESAVKLVSSLTGEPPGTANLNAVMAGTLNEVGNIVINCVIGTIGNVLNESFDFSLPNYLEGRLDELLTPHKPATLEAILLILTRFRVEDSQLEGSIFLIFEVGSFDTLINAIDVRFPRP